MYRTYVNQMNLNGKLRKKLGGQTKIGGEPWPPLRIATGADGLASAHHGFQDRILLNFTRIENANKYTKKYSFYCYV